MAAKYFLLAMLLVIAFVSTQSAKGHKKAGWENNFPKMFDTIKYKDKSYDCDDFHKMDESGNGCNCIMIGCTGARECQGPFIRCKFTNPDVDNEDIKSGECKCE